MILLSKTYETWDEEAIELGDTEDRGFEWEDVGHTFRELVELLKWMYSEPNSTHNPTWFSTEPDIDYRTGEQTTYSLHYSRKNEPRTAKYWQKAIEYASKYKRDRRAQCSQL